MKKLITLILLIACASAITKVSVPDAPSISYMGTGPDSEIFTLDKGLVLFNITGDELSNCIAYLLYPDGDSDLVFCDDGSYNYSKLVVIREGGTYGLNIDRAGNWTVKVTQVTNSNSD